MNYIENTINNKIDTVVTSLSNAYFEVLVTILSVAGIGTIGYIIYQCIRMMFFQKDECTQKIIFGYFVFLLIRICTRIMEVKIH